MLGFGLVGGLTKLKIWLTSQCRIEIIGVDVVRGYGYLRPYYRLPVLALISLEQASRSIPTIHSPLLSFGRLDRIA